MNRLGKLREELGVSLRSVYRCGGVTINDLQQIEQLSDDRLTLKHLKLYAMALRIPIEVLVNADSELALHRGAIIQAYKSVLSLEKMELNLQQANMVQILKGALEAAMPGLQDNPNKSRATHLTDWHSIRHDRDQKTIAKREEYPIPAMYYERYEPIDVPKIA